MYRSFVVGIALSAGLIPALASPAGSHGQAGKLDHCSGSFTVGPLEPSLAETWQLGDTRMLSWLIGDGCGPLTYEVEISRNDGAFELVGSTGPHQFNGWVEFPWLVVGSVGDQLIFRVRRVIPGSSLPYTHTPIITIASAVLVTEMSWSVFRACY